MANILLTGGTGYIGAHTAVVLIESGHTPILLDNFCNSSPKVAERIEQITGVLPKVIEQDVLNTAALTQVMRDERIEAVIHFAALKAVGESVAKPLAYYHNNVTGTLSVLDAMTQANVKHIVLSSSATVYGEKGVPPMREDAPLSATNPYGETKVMMERIITDVAHAQPDLRYAMLRYFNPVGAHPSGDMGEDPQGIPNNLMPYIAQVAVGRRDSLAIFGNDYPTEDGTGVRDYIHVMDLADGHVAAMQQLADKPGVHIYNLGAGVGSSVLDVVNAFSKACGKPVNYHFAPRREGDLPAYWADATKADKELNWRVTRTLDEMAQDTWHWQSRHPQGYPD